MDKTILTVIAVAALVLSGVAVLKPQADIKSPLGALTGPDIPSSYLNWGGLRTYNYSAAMASASTTCSFVSPAADSVLVFAAANVAAAPLGTTQYEWGIAATAYATTTSLGRGVIASGAQGSLIASTTQVNTGSIVDQTTLLPGGTYVNLKVGTSTPTGQSGKCFVQFVELQ